jgi:hypothetical protein
MTLKEKLLKAMLTAGEARFLVAEVVEKEQYVDLIKSICKFRSVWKTRGELIDLIQSFNAEKVVRCEWSNDRIALGKKYWIYTDFINEAQIYFTDNTNGYLKYESKSNPLYHVYIKLDQDNDKISFKLGNREKTLNLVYHSGYVSNPVGDDLLCMDFDGLKKDIYNDFLNPRMAKIGRHILKIKDVI